jgi:hypothetical protein
MVEITYKGKTRNIPKRYLAGLTGKDRQAQIKSIFEETDRPKTKAKDRKSSYTVKFDKKYGKELDAMKGKRSKRNIAKVTGIPFKAIDEVYKKGEGAYYSGGSRPNQTPQSWARGRIYGYIMGNPKVRKADKEITEKYNVKFRISTEK